MHDGTAFFDVGGDDVAAEGDDGGMSDDSVVEYGDVGGAAADIDQGDTGLFFFVGEHGLGAGDRFEGEIADFESGFFDAAEQVVDGSNLACNDVEVGLEAHAAHPDRIANALLVVHREFLRKYVDDFVARGQHELEHVVDEPVDVAAADFGVVAVAGQQSAVLEAFDVLASDADLHDAEFHAGLPFGYFDGFFDRVYRFFDVADHAAQDACAFDLAEAEHLKFAVFVSSAGHAADLCGSDVERYDDIRSLWD